MPNAINPDDYNIDKLNTGFLGPILTTDFRNYIIGFNLDDINSEVVSHGYNLGGLGDYVGNEFNNNPHVIDLPGVYVMSDTQVPLLGNNTPWESNQVMNLWGQSNPYQYTVGINTIQVAPSSQNKQAYTVPITTPLSDPGNTTIWKTGSGTATAKGAMESMINQSSYGPDYIYAYNCPDVPPEQTGFIQYKTFAGGDFRSSILGQQLGFGSGAGIEYDSDLADIGKEQRKFNLKERIKLNFIGDTLGAINADPLGLLAGQDLITKDYTITRPPGFGGKAAAFTASLVGFNLPTSILPSWMSVGGINGDDVNQDLLNNTAEGTKSLLYDSIVKNKWGPKFMNNSLLPEPKTKIGKFFSKVNDTLDSFNGAGEQPATIKYTDQVKSDVEAQEEREKPLVDKINNKVSETIDKVMRKVNPSVLPIEMEKPTPMEDPTVVNKNLGYNLEFQDHTYLDEKEAQDQFNTQPNSAKMYNNRFKSTQSTDEPELTSDKNNLFWKSGNQNKAKRGLLKYTQNMIDNSIYDETSSARYIGVTNDDSNIESKTRQVTHSDGTTYDIGNNKHKVFSQGNRVRTQDDEVYCRSWSVKNPYSKYYDTIRHEKLRRDAIFQSYSVLEDNGMPKIVPYPDDYEFSSENPSKYMLSLENLAWQGTREFNALPNCEKGPNKGRIMWFPPYDINFTDNSSVNWESTSFIGRPEPIYTYNNTERTGTLSFTVIVDHPSSLNVLRDSTRANLERYFAGCEDLTQTAFGDISPEEIEPPDEEQIPQQIDPPTGEAPKLIFYFQNSSTTDKFATGRNVYTDILQEYEINGLNASFESDLNKMIEFLLTPKGKRYRIISEGYTSALNVKGYNKVLGKDRAEALRTYLTDKLVEAETGDAAVPYDDYTEGDVKTYPKEINWINDNLRWTPPIAGGGADGPEVKDSGQDAPISGGTTQEQKEEIINNPKAKIARKAQITLEWNPNIDDMMLSKSTNEVEEINKQRQAEYNRKQLDRQSTIDEASKKLANQMVNECSYFNKIKVEDSFVYDSLKDKVRNFHPAFHSMTPEGLNSRLTFLKQCTRQGPNIAKNEPQNMAFGKPPICVLRIGDFYHTKIVIDSVNFTYEPLLWDLNPEGIGVQPMITKVDLNFKFIGGSSLGGPINELQNAVSFNFFANTSVYNRRKNVTLKKDGKSKGKPFGYGSFIFPGQKEFIESEEIDLTKTTTTDTDIPKTSEVKTEKPADALQKAAREAVKNAGSSFDEEAQKSAEPFTWDVKGQRLGNEFIITETYLRIKEEEKENWNVVFFEGKLTQPDGDDTDTIDLSVASSTPSNNKFEGWIYYSDDLESNDSQRGLYTYIWTVTLRSTNGLDDLIIRKKFSNTWV